MRNPRTARPGPPLGRLRRADLLLLLGALALLGAPLLAAASLPLNPPGTPFGPPWFLGAGAGLLVLAIGSALRATISGADPRVARRRWALVALVGLYLVYVGNQRLLSAGDNRPNQLLGIALLDQGSLDLIRWVPAAGPDLPFWVVAVDGRAVPAFPLGTGLLKVPYDFAGRLAAGGAVTEELLARWEKHFATLAAIGIVGLFYAALARRVPRAVAALSALVLALGTTIASTVSQGAWSFTGELLCLMASLRVLAGNPGVAKAVAAGAFLGAAFACRPTALFLAPAFLLFLALERRWRDLAGFAAGASTLCSLVVAGHLWLYGHPLGGYGLLNASEVPWGFEGLGTRLAGLLASPSRGLFWFVPAVLLIPLAWRAPKERLRPLWWASGLAVFTILLVTAGYGKWWGGWSLGPRLLTETMPFLVILLVPLLHPRPARPIVVGLLAVLVAAGVGTHLLGIYRTGPFAWNAVTDPDRHREALWTFRGSQIEAIWNPSWKPGIPPYPSLHPRVDRRSERIRVDLRPSANARYDLDPFDPRRADGTTHYPRIEPRALNRPKALFQFAPRGLPNALSTCRGARPRPVPLDGVRATRVHLLVAAGCASGDEPPGTVASRLVLRHANETTQTVPLRLDREVFEYRRELRGRWPPRHRIYAGTAEDADVLVRLTIPVTRPSVPLSELALQPASGTDLGVVVLAATVESPE